jgi:KUP system potassium uptake protein
MAPIWFYYPLLVIATLATIIASQAVISATFSLTKQAVLLDLYPRVRIVQTASDEKGQVYVPQMNFFLAIGTLIFVFLFRNSSAMAFAYGIAVNLVMLTVTILLLYVAHKIWQWSLFKTIILFSIILTVEIAFLGANLHKIFSGGWVPILFAIFCGIIMVTWYKGIKLLQNTYYKSKGDFAHTIKCIKSAKINYAPKSCAVFITEPYDNSGGGMLQYFKLNHIAPDRVLVVSIAIENIPYVSREKSYELAQIDEHMYRLILHIGFMQSVNMPKALSLAIKRNVFPFKLDLNHVTYLIEITHITPTLRKPSLPFFWQEKLFAFLMRNSALDIEFYHLPYNRTIAIGNYWEI